MTTDAELLQKIGEGDQNAFQQLFDRYESDLYRFALYMCGSRMLSEEIYQETWLRIMQVISKGKPVRHFKAFLFTIAKNLYRDELRKCKIREWVTGEDEPQTLFHLHDNNEQERQLEFREYLHLALQTLSLRQRQVFVLIHIQGMSIKETAEMMGCAAGTVKATLHKAVCKVRKVFKDFKEF